MISPPNTQSRPLPLQGGSARVHRRWLALARGAWIVSALFLLVNFVVSIPAYYQLMRTICTLPNQMPCTSNGLINTSGQLTSGNVQSLAQLHLTVGTYAVYFVIINLVVSLLYLGVGLLIFWRKSDEGMGLFVSLLLVFYGATSLTYIPTQSLFVVQILYYFIQAVQWTAFVAFFLTFPTGRFVPSWSWLLIVLFSIGSILYIPSLFIGLVSVLNDPVFIAVVLFSFFGLTFVIMVYRYLRVFDAVQRQQTKWFVYALAISIFQGIIITALLEVVPADSPYQLLNETVSVLLGALLPLSIGFAILRYRLWDIDVIINRTLVYGSLTALLAALYFGFIFALQFLLQGIFDKNNAVIIVLSTLAIAALFQPFRHRIQAIIDRRFYRRKYDAAKTLEAFSVTLRNEVDLVQLREHLLGVVQETMQPAHVSLWLRKPSSVENQLIRADNPPI
jgi:hypothetical protein